MINPADFPQKSDAELLEILRTHSPGNVNWEGVKATLEARNAGRMVESSRRMERATYLILIVAVIQLVVTLVAKV